MTGCSTDRPKTGLDRQAYNRELDRQACYRELDRQAYNRGSRDGTITGGSTDRPDPCYPLSRRIDKVVASHAEVARSILG